MHRDFMRQKASSLRTLFRNRRAVLIERLEPRALLSSAISFAAPTTIGLQTTAEPVITAAVGDVNRDKIPDLLPIRLDSTIQNFYGTATGALTLGPIIGTGGTEMALDDFNGDGKLDLATAGGIRLGNGDGTFAAAITGFTLPTGAVRFFTGDFNGDGKEDLAVATLTFAGTQGQTPTIGLTVFLGNGNGTLQPPVSTVIASGANLLGTNAVFITGDFNLDGKLDVVSPFGVSLGNGDGTFRAPIPLPLASSTNPPPPASSVFAVADFNGDNKLDMAIVPNPSSTNTGTSTTPAQLEILMGNGNGTFTDKGPITLGAVASISTLTIGDVNNDGIFDLLAGTSSATNKPGITILPGNTDGTFATPTTIATGGIPVQILTADFNADGLPDLISLNAAANVTPSPGFQITAISAQTFINTSPGPLKPTVTLQVPKNPLSGAPVQLTATLTPPPGSPAATGNVVFLDGTTKLGTAPVINGTATLITTALGVGPRSLTASYGGDANYASATSGAVTATVLLTDAPVPLLVPTLGTINFPAQFLPRDLGNAQVTLINAGGAPARGTVAIELFLSPTGQLDSSTILLRVVKKSVAIASGQTISFTPAFTAGTYPGAQYRLLAELLPIAHLTSDQVASAPAVSATQFQAVTNVFGTVGTHSKITFTGIDASGNKATLWMTGPGQGTVSSRAGQINVNVTGTVSTSVLHIATTGGPIAFGTISIPGALAFFDGSRASMTGDVVINGNVSLVSLKSAGASTSVSGAISRAAPPGGGGGGGNPPVFRPVTGTAINITGTAKTSFTLGTMQDVTLQTTGPIGTLRASSWLGGNIFAPFINNLDAGSMSGNVFIHGGKIASARLGSWLGGTWAVAGGIDSLSVSGNATLARIYAGADAGPDNVLGSSDDTYDPATIGSISIGGNADSIVIAAGAVPAPGGTITSGFNILPQGAIHSVTVRGAVSDDTRFLAGILPATATLSRHRVQTALDSHFQL